jgi:uncharacterized protein YjbI with pentapeptide repeats
LVALSSVGRQHVPLELAHANLERANLFAVDLRGANLAGANLRGAMLWSARLDAAVLDAADLTCANLTWAWLVGCSMRETLLIEADLDEAVVGDPVDIGLRCAFTAGADMVTINDNSRVWADWWARYRQAEGASERAQLQAEAFVLRADPARDERGQALLLEHIQTAPSTLRMRGAQGFEHKGEELERAKARVLTDDDLHDLLRWSSQTGNPLNLRGCNLTGANLRNANLDGACLAFADLTGADIRGASFVGADTNEADMPRP